MTKGSSNGKAPSVEWFFNDWHGGTAILTRHQKGCFMDLLHAQFNNGHLSIEAIKNVLGNDFAAWQGVLSKKFRQDEDGLYYNFRLDIQIKKKVAYSTSRSNNLNSFVEHMGNGNGLDLDNRKKVFETKLNQFVQYSEEMRKDFLDYWTEPNASNTKMLYETKKTFEMGRRLARWQKNNFDRPGNSEFPNNWNKELYYKLQSSDVPKFERYKKHLRDLGFEPVRYSEGMYKGSLKAWERKQTQAA